MTASVIIPAYNASGTIKKAVQSVIEQNNCDFEILIIDDGSTDDTPGQAAQLLKQDARISYHRLVKSGIARALNFGIKMSQGQYIVRMDADDEALPQRIDKLTDYLNQHNDVGLVASLVQYKGDERSHQGYYRYVEWVNSILSHDDTFTHRFRESPFAHPSVCFRKSLFAQYGGYHEGPYPEDYELWLRWLQHGVIMHKLDEPLLIWHDRPNRLSRTHIHYSQEQFFKVKSRYFHQWLLDQYGYSDWPKIYIWGAGRVVNNRVKHLAKYGVYPDRYIDVKKHLDSKFLHYSDIPPPGDHLILSYVSDWKGRVEIEEYLQQKGYLAGQTYFMMA